MATRILMITSAAFLALIGLAESFVPEKVLEIHGTVPDNATLLMVQMMGAIYLGFAFLNWMARGVLIGGIYARPIAIGNFEATAIFMELYNEPPPRPITYDLLRSILEGFDVKVEKILINALKEDTFYAEVDLVHNGHQMSIDSRPSDAIALAIRIGAPIFVASEVLQEAGLVIDKKADSGKEEFTEDDLMTSFVEQKSEVAAPGSVAGQQVVALKARLQEAVAQEEYEEAARLRDEIGRLESGLQKR